MLEQIIKLVNELKQDKCNNCDNEGIYIAFMYCEEHKVMSHIECELEDLDKECSVFGSKSADDMNSCTWQEEDIIHFKDNQISLINENYIYDENHVLSMRCMKCHDRIDG